MKLSELYNEAINEKSVWRRLESILKDGETLIEELSGGLEPLLKEANKVVFQKFNIDPKQKIYFISGSARLYLYPDLIAELNKMDGKNFPLQVGDLDLVIPNEELWKKAGLSEFLHSGIYRPYQLNPPVTKMNIEVFTVWAPNRTPGFENLQVRSEQEIFNDLEFFEGYWFMGLEDVIDYKDKMKRDKEIALSDLIRQYEQGGGVKEERPTFIKRVAQIITGNFAPKLTP
jgi:hypothetical protein